MCEDILGNGKKDSLGDHGFGLQGRCARAVFVLPGDLGNGYLDWSKEKSLAQLTVCSI